MFSGAKTGDADVRLPYFKNQDTGPDKWAGLEIYPRVGFHQYKAKCFRNNLTYLLKRMFIQNIYVYSVYKILGCGVCAEF